MESLLADHLQQDWMAAEESVGQGGPRVLCLLCATLRLAGWPRCGVQLGGLTDLLPRLVVACRRSGWGRTWMAGGSC